MASEEQVLVIDRSVFEQVGEFQGVQYDTQKYIAPNRVTNINTSSVTLEPATRMYSATSSDSPNHRWRAQSSGEMRFSRSACKQD